MVSRRTMLTAGLSAATIGAVGYGFWPRLDRFEDEVSRQRRMISSDPTLEEFVRMATLAASGHNTQPWKFQLGDNNIQILPDLSRQTAVVDPDDHHLYLSLGCAAENLAIAALAHGRIADISINKDVDTFIDISLNSGTAHETQLYEAIPHRQSTRSVYDGQALSLDDLKLLKTAAQEEGVSVKIITDNSQREDILEFVVEGNSAQMDDPAFVKELLDWIRFSSNQALQAKDGLFSACSGNPVVPEWLGGAVFSKFFTKKVENDKYCDQIRSSAGVAVFTGDRADPEHWIKVGRSFQRFALQATALGIRNAHINQPIEVPSIRPEFARWLGMPEMRPDLVVRFGRAPALPMSLRRPVSSVLV